MREGTMLYFREDALNPLFGYIYTYPKIYMYNLLNYFCVQIHNKLDISSNEYNFFPNSLFHPKEYQWMNFISILIYWLQYIVVLFIHKVLISADLQLKVVTNGNTIYLSIAW